MKELPEDIQAKITAYIEGQLPPDEAAALEVYLANTDPAISEMVMGMLADRHSVQNLPRLAAPQDFSARVMEQIERSSLLAGVEHELIPHRPWWQTRAAIAAGLALVLGGFTYFVVDAIRRPAQPWHNATAVVPPAGKPGAVALAGGDRKLDEVAASVRDEKKKSGSESTERAKDATDDVAKQALLSEAANDVSRRSQAGEKGITARNGAPAALTMNLDRSSDEQMRVSGQVAVARDRMTAAKDNGFLVEESPQKALSTVYAGDKRSLEGPPVLVTLVSRRADDPERLRVMLEGFASEAARVGGNSAVDAKQAPEPAYIGTGKLAVNNTGGNALALNGSNVTGNTTTSLNGPNVSGNATTISGAIVASNVTTTNAITTLNAGGPAALNTKGASTFDGNLNQNYTRTGADATLNNGGRNQFNGNYDNYAVQGNLSQQQAGTNSQLANGATQYLVSPVAQFGQSASSYRRVFLRPRQLERITVEFQVASISRGQLAYVIAPHEEAELRKEKSEYAAPREGLEKTLAPNGPAAAPGGYPARAVTKAPVSTLARAVSEVPAPATRFQPAIAAATQPAGAGSGGSAHGGMVGKSGAGAKEFTVVDKDRVEASPMNDRESKAKGDRQDQPESGAAEQQKAEAGPWLEVIIAMEPGVVASPAGSAPASMQSEGQFNSKGAGKPASK